MNQQDKILLITGGRGFIGVNIVQAISPSREVRVLDSLQRASPTGRREGVADFYCVDTLEPAALAPVFDGMFDVVHLAAYGSVVQSVAEPGSNFATYDKVHNAFGFEPKWRLEDGLAATWEWFLSQGEAVLAVETTDS